MCNHFHCQQRGMEHTGHWEVHEECIVFSAVCHKTQSDVEQWKIKPVALTVLKVSFRLAVSHSILNSIRYL